MSGADLGLDPLIYSLAIDLFSDRQQAAICCRYTVSDVLPVEMLEL
jgi:hypothetical protein